MITDTYFCIFPFYFKMPKLINVIVDRYVEGEMRKKKERGGIVGYIIKWGLLCNK